MNLRSTRKEELEINVTPLIDVVFLLLIFFMVSTTFNREAELKIQLPEASGAQREQPPKAIEITIDAQGRYFVNRQEVLNNKLDTLKQAMANASTGRKDVPLVISSDQHAPFQAVIRAMDAARQLGIVNLTFATRQPPEQ